MNKKSLITIGTIIAVTVAGIFWYVNSRETITDLGDNEISIENGWKRVTNQLYGYTIDIPESWYEDMIVLNDATIFTVENHDILWVKEKDNNNESRINVSFNMGGSAVFEKMTDEVSPDYGVALQYYDKVISGRTHKTSKDEPKIPGIPERTNSDSDMDRSNRKSISVTLSDKTSEKDLVIVKKIIRSFKVLPQILEEEKVYDNKRYGFSFKYPKNLFIYNSGIVNKINGAGVSGMNVDAIIEGATSIIKIYRIDSESFEKKVKRLEKSKMFKNKTEINDVVLIESCGWSEDKYDCSKSDIKFFRKLNDGSYLCMGTNLQYANKESLVIIKKIAESLVIYDGTVLEVGMKTYTSEKFGFSIDFPSNWEVGIEENREVVGLVGHFDGKSIFSIYPLGAPNPYGRAFDGKEWKKMTIANRDAWYFKYDDAGGLFLENRIRFNDIPNGWNEDHYFDFNITDQKTLDSILDSMVFFE